MVGWGGDGVEIAPRIPDVSKWPHTTSAACEPLDRMVGLTSSYQYVAVVEQSVSPVSSAAGDKQTSEMALASYHATDAPKVIADLRSSLRTCSSFSEPRIDTEYTDPEPLADPEVGDEAVAYRINEVNPSVDSNGDEDGGPTVVVPFNFVVVRCGATIAAFYTMSPPGEPRPPHVSTDVVTAQIDKLGRMPLLV